MIPSVFATNMTSWLIQVLLIASVGAALPWLFRVRHPRSQLAYYHLVLILCLTLPLIQPWQSSLIVTTMRESGHQPTAATSISWTTIGLWILAAGGVVRFCWLAAGLWQLRCYRRSAVPMNSVPISIREAKRLSGVGARFSISSSVQSPATMGWIDPVVLLPPTFLTLASDAQRGIACHELLHIRRRDWLITIFEELAGAFFWFNPGVWWLLAQAKLSREQLVDAEVVRLTDREPYVQALLSMALVSRRQWSLPAASFFTRGHFMGRMRLLLADTRRSVLCLSVSYTAITSLLLTLLWCVFAWFPLWRDANVVMAYLPSPSQLLPSPGGEHETPRFDPKVPAPEGQIAEVRYFVSLMDRDIDGLGQDVVFRLSAPTRPPSAHLVFEGLEGIRMVRPGEIASPEQVRQLVDALGGRAVLDIQQSENGTVQRVTIQSRRLRDETDSVNTGISTAATDPAPLPDRID